MIQSNQIHRFAAPVAVLRYFIELIHKNHQKSPKQLHRGGWSPTQQAPDGSEDS